MKNTALIASFLILSSATTFAGAGTPSFQETLASAKESSEWKCRVTLYGWAEGLSGTTGVKGFTAPVDANFRDIVDDLNFGAMGAIEISNGRGWGFAADMVYADLGASQIGPLGGTTKVDMSQFLGNFVFAYEAYKSEPVSIDVYAGVRVNSLDLDLSFRGPGNVLVLATSGSETWVDPIIGVRFQAELPNHFFLRALGDVGGFAVSSQFTWQAMGAIGYHLSDMATLLLGYRAIGTDYKNGGFTYDLVSSGLLLGYQYTF